MNMYYVNGQFVEESQAQISVNDLSVIRGFGVFDFLRTYNGIPFHLTDHLLRLERSARLIGLTLPHSTIRLTEIVQETLARNNYKESYIRLVVTGGQSFDGITPGDSPQVLVMIYPAKELPEEWYTKGAKVITCHVERFLPGAKSINYIPAILCQAEARSQQAIEAIYVDRDGYLLEGTTSNIFFVRDKTLVTPPCDRVLPGITRQVVLDLARGNFGVEERRVHKDELRLLDEAFLTSSVKEIVPLQTIDTVALDSAGKDSCARQILQLFKDYSAGYEG